MKVFVFFLLGLFIICISSCDYVKNKRDKVVEIATPEVTEENVIVKTSADQVAEEPPMVKPEKRPLVPSKRTGKIGDIPAVRKIDDVTPVKYLEYSDRDEHAEL